MFISYARRHGQVWRQQLTDELDKADAVVLALTSNWLTSAFCQWEFITAVEADKKVVPVLLEAGLKLPHRLSQYQYADFSTDFTDVVRVQQFLDDVFRLAVLIDRSTLEDMETKEAYALRIDQQNSGSGHYVSVSGSGNTVAGGNIDQSRQNIHIGGNVSGGNVNIGGKQTFHGNVNIHYSALPSASAGSPLEELKNLLQELETALRQTPASQVEDAELVAEYANEIAEEVAKEAPRRKKLEITGENLKKAAENLLAVSPIAVKIAKTLLLM